VQCSLTLNSTSRPSISILIVVGTCTRSCARRRVSRQSRARRSRVSACRSDAACPRVAAKPPCDPPCGRAQLVNVITRHSLVRAKGEVFVLLLLFCSLFCQRCLDNPRTNSRQILHAGVLWFRMCLLPFWGLAAPGGRKKGEMKFLLLWESMGNFCILAVF